MPYLCGMVKLTSDLWTRAWTSVKHGHLVKKKAHLPWLKQNNAYAFMFWCTGKNEFALYFLQENLPTPPSNLSHHIVACIFSEEDSPLIGLGSFIMPLRASNFHYSELKYVILLGNMEYIKREWTSIKNFPKILVMPVSTENYLGKQC